MGNSARCRKSAIDGSRRKRVEAERVARDAEERKRAREVRKRGAREHSALEIRRLEAEIGRLVLEQDRREREDPLVSRRNMMDQIYR